jgi:hypothetical protein
MFGSYQGRLFEFGANPLTLESESFDNAMFREKLTRPAAVDEKALLTVFAVLRSMTPKHE